MKQNEKNKIYAIQYKCLALLVQTEVLNITRAF